MPPKCITIFWWQGLHPTNYGLIFCVTFMSLCLTLIMFYSWQIRRLINPLETAQNLNIQFAVPLPWNTITVISKLFCHKRESQYQWKRMMPIIWYMYIYIYIYIYITFRASARTGMLRHTPLDSSRRQRRIATVYSWQTETGKPYLNIESLYDMVSIFRNIPDK